MSKSVKSRSLRRGLTLIMLFGVFLCVILGLGVLRFHAARLAYYLDSLNLSIQKYADEETSLRQELSALVAPIKIYSYCKERLGMQKVLRAETLPVHMRSEHLAAKNDNGDGNGNGQSTWRSSLAWLFGK